MKKVCHSGVCIGSVDEFLAKDIGLIDPVVPVSNDCLETKTNARNLVRTEDIADHDTVRVETCFTGPQLSTLWGLDRESGLCLEREVYQICMLFSCKGSIGLRLPSTETHPSLVMYLWHAASTNRKSLG